MQENKVAVIPVHRLLLNMAWPIMLSMLIQAPYNLVNNTLVAQLSSDGSVALALVYSIRILIIAVCVGIGVGFNILLIRRLGEDRPDEADRVVANGYFIYLVCWAVFLALGMGLVLVFMELFVLGQPQVIDYGVQYLPIVTGTSIGVRMQSAEGRTLQAIGNTADPMVIQGISTVINLILDSLLIFGIGPFPRIGAAGTALTTVLGRVVGVVVRLCMVRRSPIVYLFFRSSRLDSAIIRTMFRVGIPVILVRILVMVINLGMNLVPPLFTASGVFILEACFKLQSFLFMPVNSLNNALILIVNFNYGVRQHNRITGVIHFALVLSTAVMTVSTVVFLIVPGPLLRLFSADAAVLVEGISALHLITLSFVYAGVSVILCAALQTLGTANSDLMVPLLRQPMPLFPLALLLSAPRSSLAWLAFLLPEGAACPTAPLLHRRTARGRLAGMEE